MEYVVCWGTLCAPQAVGEVGSDSAQTPHCSASRGGRVLTQHGFMMLYQTFQLVFSQYMTSFMLSHGRRVCYAWSLHKGAVVLGYNKRGRRPSDGISLTSKPTFGDS